MEDKLTISLKEVYNSLREYIDDVTEQAYEQKRVLAHVAQFSRLNHRFRERWVTPDIDTYVTNNLDFVLEAYNEFLEYNLIRSGKLDVNQALYNKQGFLTVEPADAVVTDCIKCAHGMTIQQIMSDLGLGTTFIERESLNSGSPPFNIIL